MTEMTAWPTSRSLDIYIYTSNIYFLWFLHALERLTLALVSALGHTTLDRLCPLNQIFERICAFSILFLYFEARERLFEV